MDCFKVQEKKKEVVALCSRRPQNVKLGAFTFSRAVTAMKCAKSLMQVQSCCFAYQTYCFLAVLVAVSVVFSKAPYYLLDKT